MANWKAAPLLIRLSVITVLIALILSGCGSTGARQDSAAPLRPVGEMKGQTAQNTVSAPKKVIQTANMSLETGSLTEVEKQISALVGQRQGTIDNINVSQDDSGQRRGSYTIRVPQGKLQELVDALAAIPDVVVRQRSVSSQDVTEEYIDVNARLENMQRHETRLRELLARANTVDEILKVESELSRVRTQIESTTAKLKNLTGRIELSTLQLTVREVNGSYWSNYGGKIRHAFQDGIITAGNVFLGLITGVIGLTPLAAFIAAVVWLWRKRKAVKKSNPAPPAQ